MLAGRVTSAFLVQEKVQKDHVERKEVGGGREGEVEEKKNRK